MWIPLIISREKRVLVTNPVGQGHRYKFILDSGAHISLAQPYVSNRPVEET
jgi:hypothetical protein